MKHALILNATKSKYRMFNQSHVPTAAKFLVGIMALTAACSKAPSSGVLDVPSEFSSGVEDFFNKTKLDAAYQKELAKLTGFSLGAIVSSVPDQVKFSGEQLSGLSSKVGIIVKGGDFASFQKKHKDLRTLLASYGTSFNSLRAKDLDTGLQMVRDVARSPGDLTSMKQTLSKYSSVDTAKAVSAMVIFEALNTRYGKDKAALSLSDEEAGLELTPAADPVTAGFNAAAAWSPGATATGLGTAATGIGAGHLSWEQGEACKAQSRAVKAAADKQAEWNKCSNIQPDESTCDKDHDGDQAAGGSSRDGSAHCGTFGFIWECKGKLVKPTWMKISEPPFPPGASIEACSAK